jgi:hypothetical protein
MSVQTRPTPLERLAARPDQCPNCLREVPLVPCRCGCGIAACAECQEDPSWSRGPEPSDGANVVR